MGGAGGGRPGGGSGGGGVGDLGGEVEGDLLGPWALWRRLTVAGSSFRIVMVLWISSSRFLRAHCWARHVSSFPICLNRSSTIAHFSSWYAVLVGLVFHVLCGALVRGSDRVLGGVYET